MLSERYGVDDLSLPFTRDRVDWGEDNYLTTVPPIDTSDTLDFPVFPFYDAHDGSPENASHPERKGMWAGYDSTEDGLLHRLTPRNVAAMRARRRAAPPTRACFAEWHAEYGDLDPVKFRAASARGTPSSDPSSTPAPRTSSTRSCPACPGVIWRSWLRSSAASAKRRLRRFTPTSSFCTASAAGRWCTSLRAAPSSRASTTAPRTSASYAPSRWVSLAVTFSTARCRAFDSCRWTCFCSATGFRPRAAPRDSPPRRRGSRRNRRRRRTRRVRRHARRSTVHVRQVRVRPRTDRRRAGARRAAANHRVGLVSAICDAGRRWGVRAEGRVESASEFSKDDVEDTPRLARHAVGLFRDSGDRGVRGDDA